MNYNAIFGRKSIMKNSCCQKLMLYTVSKSIIKWWWYAKNYYYIQETKQWHMMVNFQGPCSQNQLALAHSRLWDAVGGFLYIFAHMQDKLSKVSLFCFICSWIAHFFLKPKCLSLMSCDIKHLKQQRCFL